MSDCLLVAWKGEKGHCNWCDKELTGRQLRWCSTTCSEAYGTNHWWGWASKAAKDRDGHRCTRCGHSPSTFTEPEPDLDWNDAAKPQWQDFKLDNGKLDHLKFSKAMAEWRRPHDEWSRRRGQHRRRTQLEVHHIKAAKGKHSTASCIHHLDNLVTLCHACHLEAERARRLSEWEIRNQTTLPL